MFDNSCELFENEMQHKNIESEKRIKEIVFLGDRSHQSQKKSQEIYICFWQRQWELEESLLGHMKF